MTRDVLQQCSTGRGDVDIPAWLQQEDKKRFPHVALTQEHPNPWVPLMPQPTPASTGVLWSLSAGMWESLGAGSAEEMLFHTQPGSSHSQSPGSSCEAANSPMRPNGGVQAGAGVCVLLSHPFHCSLLCTNLSSLRNHLPAHHTPCLSRNYFYSIFLVMEKPKLSTVTLAFKSINRADGITVLALTSVMASLIQPSISQDF